MRGLYAIGFIVCLALLARDDARGRAQCEAIHTPETCTHILRG